MFARHHERVTHLEAGPTGWSPRASWLDPSALLASSQPSEDQKKGHNVGCVALRLFTYIHYFYIVVLCVKSTTRAAWSCVTAGRTAGTVVARERGGGALMVLTVRGLGEVWASWVRDCCELNSVILRAGRLFCIHTKIWRKSLTDCYSVVQNTIHMMKSQYTSCSSGVSEIKHPSRLKSHTQV